METFPEQNTWLNQLSQTISQEEWLSGIDLYRENRISKVERFEHLICGSVQTIEGKRDVRIKLHPNGRIIQWVECTCARNRKKGIYCSHIAALFFHIHQERSDFPPETYINQAITQTPHDTTDSAQTMVHGLFQQGRGNIVKIETRGSKLVVYFEVKAGQVSHIDLDVDKQPAFLDSLADIERKLLPENFRQMKVIENSAMRGLYFYLDETQKLIGRKAYALKRGPSRRIPSEFENYHEKMSVCFAETQEDIWVQLFPEDSLSPWIGQKYFVIPGVGYFEIGAAYEGWTDLAQTLKFTDSQAIDLISSKFESYSRVGKVFLHKSISNLQIVDDLALSELRVVQENNGWFYLDPRYVTNGESVGMLDLFTRYAKNKTPFLKSDKMWIRVPEIMINGQWSIDTSSKCLKVSNLELIKLKQSLGNEEKITGKEYLLQKLKDSTEFNTSINTPTLEHTKLTLREYQKKGYEWLWWLYNHGLHGLLADDMGLGKTHQAMAVMSAIQKQLAPNTHGPMFLCVCPTTVLDHWLDKIDNFAPNLKPIKYYGPKRDQLTKLFPQCNTIVTTYGVLLRDFALLERYDWQVILLDEAHFVKNNKTATYKAACRLRGRLRVCLSGTPMENRLSELKNIFDFIVPGYLGTDRDFNKNFVSPIEGQKSNEKEQELRNLIQPLKLRRTKEQVLSDLPEKVEDTRHCWLSAEQVALYKEVLASQAAPLVDSLKTKQGPIPYLHVFTILQLLKQICNHPALIRKTTDWRDGESGKFELFRNLLSEALESNHKIVIYSQYLQMIEIIKNYLTELKISHVVLTGKSQKRGEIVKKFQEDPEVKVFIGSLLAGGLGIDLTAASVVIHYDRWWNASKENQATDRVHRIGQKNFTQVIKLVTRGTLEEKIDTMIAEKANLFNRFLEKDEEAFKNLTREDLINLLQ